MNLRQIAEAGRAVLRNLALGGNLAAASLLTRPRLLLNYTAETLFLLRTLADRRGVPQKNVFEVLGGGPTRDVSLGNLDGDTWFWTMPSYTADLVSLCLVCRILAPRAVFEIGTLHGYMALHFALNTGPDAIIHTLDLPQDEPARTRLHTTVMDDAHIRQGTAARQRVFERADVAGKVRALHGDSATFDFSPYHDAIDFFFIDGAHSYDYVASDTRNAFRCIRPGGVIAWHDFGRSGVNGVTRLVREVARERDVFSIPGGSVAYTVVR